MKLFVTATGTGVGKTWLATELAARRRALGRNVGALKPIETGCDPDPLDAQALAAASGHPALARAPGLYRARQPLAPYAATLHGEPPPPAVAELVEATTRALAPHDDWVVEGAGGLLVPYDAEHDLADLALRLALPLVLVAPDVLGTLSHTRTALESARARGLKVIAIALSCPTPVADVGTRNAEILRQRLGDLPVFELAHAPHADPTVLDALSALADD